MYVQVRIRLLNDFYKNSGIHLFGMLLLCKNIENQKMTKKPNLTHQPRLKLF